MVGNGVGEEAGKVAGSSSSVVLWSKWDEKLLGGREMGVMWFMFLKKSSIAVGRM